MSVGKECDNKYKQEAIKNLEPLLSDYSYYAEELDKLLAVLYHILTKHLGVEEAEDLIDIICTNSREELIEWFEELFQKKM